MNKDAQSFACIRVENPWHKTDDEQMAQKRRQAKTAHLTKRNSKPEDKTRDFALKNSACFYCNKGNDNSQTKIHCMETGEPQFGEGFIDSAEQ